MDSPQSWRTLVGHPVGSKSREQGFRAAKDNKSFLQRLSLLNTLDSHRGCVNTVVWNETGQYVLSGSDDHRLIITNPYNKKVKVDLMTSHKANIFSAKFLPGTSDRKIISCAGDGTLLYTDLEKIEETHRCTFTCHNGTAYELQTVSGDPNSFLSCGEDGTVRWFDLRTKDKCCKSECKEDILISLSNAVTSIALNPMLPYNLAVGSSDSAVRIFDRRMLGSRPTSCMAGLVSRFLLPEMVGKRRRITSLDFRPDGEEVLVSFSSDYIYTFNPRVDDPNRAQRLFVGRPPKSVKERTARVQERSPPPMKRLRLRGDWSDTGPNAMPDSQSASIDSTGPAYLMQRMTDALSRIIRENRRAPGADAADGPVNESQPIPEEAEDNNSGNEEDTPLIRRTSPTPTQESSSQAQEVMSAVSPSSSSSNDDDVESPQNERTFSPTDRNLPGPSQVVTHPGTSGTNPATGERQRRRGVSGPPSGTIEFPSGLSGLANLESSLEDEDDQEFEYDDEDSNEKWRRVVQPERLTKLTGHRNARTMIKEATWWGNNFIISGSDCGHIIGWDRTTAEIVFIRAADEHVVNCVQPHPFDPVLVTSGIDYNVKVWSPIKDEPDFNPVEGDILRTRNEMMLKMTQDTVTVPATMMIRMIASLSQMRRAQLLLMTQELG